MKIFKCRCHLCGGAFDVTLVQAQRREVVCCDAMHEHKAIEAIADELITGMNSQNPNEAMNYFIQVFDFELDLLIRSHLGPEEAEAIKWELYMSFFEGSFKNPVTYFRGYVLKATRNKIIDVIRRRKSERKRTPELIRLDSLDPSKKEALLNSAVLGAIDASAGDQDEIVKRAVEKLKQSHRDVIQQVYFNKLSYENTARILDVEVGTVKSRLNRAIRELRKIIAGDKKKDKS